MYIRAGIVSLYLSLLPASSPQVSPRDGHRQRGGHPQHDSPVLVIARSYRFLDVVFGLEVGEAGLASVSDAWQMESDE